MQTSRGFLVAGLLILVAACGPGPSSPETEATQAGPGTSPTSGPTRTATAVALTVTPTGDDLALADRSCPTEFSGAVSIQPHPLSSDYAFEIAGYLNAAGTEDLEFELSLLTSTHSGEPQVGRAKVHVFDLDGDGRPEVVVELLFIPVGSWVSGHVYVFRCEAGAYAGGSVGSFDYTAAFADSARNSSLGLRSTDDLNGDGLPELVLSWVTTFEMDPVEARSDYTRGFQIVGWDGKALTDLLPPLGIGGEPVVTVANGDGSLRDSDGDGLIELVLHGGAIAPGTGHPLFRPRTETWGWDGQAFALRCVAFGAGDFRFQAVEDGDAALLCGDRKAALEAYQKAIFDESLKPWLGDELGMYPAPESERLLLGAYSRYRLLLIHVANGTQDAAEVVYQGLLDRHSAGTIGGEYAELAEVLWGAYRSTADLGSACRKVLAEARDLTSVSDQYGYFSRLFATPEYLCPF